MPQNLKIGPPPPILKKPPRPGESPPLLDLPPELRLRELGFAVMRSSHEKPIEPDIVGFYILGLHHEDPEILDERWLPTGLKRPAITRTCRLLRGQGLKLYCAKNTFSVSCGGRYSHRRLNVWLQQINHVRFPARHSILGAQLSTVMASSNMLLRMRRGKVLLGAGALERSYQICFQAQPERSEDEDICMSLGPLRTGEIDWNSKFLVVDGQD